MARGAQGRVGAVRRRCGRTFPRSHPAASAARGAVVGTRGRPVAHRRIPEKHIQSADQHLEPVERRFLHRLPWLLVGLAGAMLAADLVGWFETELQLKVVLAFFIPGIVYLADAVGTQTETVVVRGLSAGVPMKSMVRRELLTGLAIGIALAAIATPLVWWRWEDADLAISAGLALFAACSTATLAG